MKVTLTFNIGDKTVELTLDEARDLYEKLDSVFGNEAAKKIEPHYPYPQAPMQPYYPYPDTFPTYPKPIEIWCGQPSSTSEIGE